jgi:capsular polysaccharide biosynthesis protein
MDNNDINMDKSMLSIAQTIWNGRKTIIIVGILAIVISSFVSLLIKNQYKATATIFPPVANQISKELITENKQEGLTTFGETEEMEQFLQVLSSRTLKDKVISRLNLRHHWGIDSASGGSRFKSYQKFDEQIKIKPTRYQSINIEVMDRDPEWAAKIANTVVEYSDSLMRSIKAQVAVNALKVLEKQFALVEHDLNNLQDSLAAVMVNGVIDPKRQAGQFYKEYLNALSKSNKSTLSILNKEVAKLGGFGAKHTRYTFEISDLSTQLNELRKSIVVARIEAYQEIPTQFIIDKANIPDKKAYPKRTIIVVTSTLSAIIFAIFLLFLQEYIKRLKKEL